MNRYKEVLGKVFMVNQSGDSWLVALRVGVAVALIAKIISEFRFINDLYGSDGFVPNAISHFSQNPYLPSLQSIWHLAGGVLPESQFLIAFFLSQLLFAVFLFLGFVNRFSAFMCWFMQVVVFNSSHLTSYGFDAILLSLLFYALILPTGNYFSIDDLRKKTVHDRSMIPIFQKVLQIHLCLIYFVNGLSKINGHTWQEGSGMWDALNQPQFQSLLTPLLQKLFMIDHLPAVITWATIGIEIAFPFLIWVRSLNILILLSILLLHVFIALVFGLWLFAFVMIVFNLVAFGHILRKRKMPHSKNITSRIPTTHFF